MRAGRYAVVEGVAYDLLRLEGWEGAPLRVTARWDAPAPPGFTNSGAGWERRVLPEEISAIYEVKTTARYRGWPVIVRGVDGDRAYIEYVGAQALTAPELAHLERSNWRDVVAVADLTEVIEQKVDLPIPPAGSSWASGPVRAGLYAVYEGTAYRAHSADTESLWLLVADGDPIPAGFERARSGLWRRRVAHTDLDVMFAVRTTARWKGNPVNVRGVLGGHAEIEYLGHDIAGHPELTYHQHGIWDGTVPADSLTHVIELPYDVG